MRVRVGQHDNTTQHSLSLLLLVLLLRLLLCCSESIDARRPRTLKRSPCHTHRERDRPARALLSALSFCVSCFVSLSLLSSCLAPRLRGQLLRSPMSLLQSLRCCACLG